MFHSKIDIIISFFSVSFEKQFENIGELSRQKEIRYGLVARGTTADFFRVLKYIELILLFDNFFSLLFVLKFLTSQANITLCVQCTNVIPVHLNVHNIFANGGVLVQIFFT